MPSSLVRRSSTTPPASVRNLPSRGALPGSAGSGDPIDLGAQTDDHNVIPGVIVNAEPTPLARPTQSTSEDATAPDERYLNRETTWIAFNQRVLAEARDARNPLIERLRFLTIFHTNLDEFFMVRVSGLKQQVHSGVEVVSMDGLSARSQLHCIREQLLPILDDCQDCLDRDLLPELRERGVDIVHYADLSPELRERADTFYRRKVHPVLTPLAVGPTKTFPFISNLSLNIAVYVRSPSTGERRLARLKIPSMLPRLVRIDSGNPLELRPPVQLLPLEELIASNLHTLFPSMEVEKPWIFRVTRDADLEIKEDEADDLLTAIREEVRNRRFGRAVRIEVQRTMPEDLREALRKGLELDPEDVYLSRDPLDVPGLKQLLNLDVPADKFPPFVPRPQPIEDIFAEIQRDDLLFHHPYEAFTPVVEFLESAARDPHVRAIKQTLYRTSGDSPVIKALLEAVQNGKQVAAVVELKARFDEENNITWAQMLEESGVHVIFGEIRRKVHAKMSLVVRSEQGELRRYAHIGTGNYNPTTARIYTDLSLFTCNPEITGDVADLFNRLTGFSEPVGYRRLLVAWRFMHDRLLEMIADEIAHARAGRPAHLIFKCNAIAEQRVIDALYEASEAGVRVDLLVRGICCLRPGVAGLSENITVRSVLGRFLEHSRVYWFRNGGEPRVYLGSADLMDRNLKNRIEVLVPVLHAGQADWLREVFLERYLTDEGRSWIMHPDGRYSRTPGNGKPNLDVQQAFLDEE
ncbi:MAG: polyphosphate kinase 1 [Deltaproteobacteria bacterium]|nr:MAG: polyphosphate kinase 1 [Deltaproteobacteria bacterium]